MRKFHAAEHVTQSQHEHCTPTQQLHMARWSKPTGRKEECHVTGRVRRLDKN